MNRNTRINQLKNMIKEDDSNELISLLLKKTYRDYNQFIKPIINEKYPEFVNDKFYSKFKLTTRSLYSLGAYVMLLISGKRYKIYRTILNKLNFNKKTIIFLFSLMKFNKKIRKNIIYVSAFCTMIDHIFDDELKKLKPEDRTKKIKSLFKKEDKGILSLFREVILKMDQKQVKSFINSWCSTEAKSLKLKKGFRNCGIEKSMEILYDVIKYDIDKKNINLMYETARLVQMVDDYIDLEDDMKNNKITPFMEKKWDFNSINKQYNLWLILVSKISKENGASNKLHELIISNSVYTLKTMINKMASKEAN